MDVVFLMDYDVIIIRYGELALKSRYVRKQFESALVSNIHAVFQKHNVEYIVKKIWGRIYLYIYNIVEGVALLQKIFGITSVSPAKQTTADITTISHQAVNLAKDYIDKNTSFALRVTRTGNHSYTSQDIAIKIGDDIVKATNAHVNLTNPDFELFIEIRDKNAFLFLEKYPGTGGLPYGTQGNVCAFIDSPSALLASWYVMKRGCKVFFITTNQDLMIQTQSFLSSWDVHADIVTISQGTNCYKDLKDILIEKHCDAMVLGTSLNSHGALDRIKIVKKAIDHPILCPLIAMDTEEIEQQGKHVGIHL